MGSRSWLMAGVYVGTVTVLAASAFSDPRQGFSAVEAAALLLTLPAMVVGLPVLYVVGAAAWNLTGADAAGPMWPVTVAYAATFAVIAAANVWLCRSLLRLLLARRAPRNVQSGDPAGL
jgi:hypothetical protein